MTAGVWTRRARPLVVAAAILGLAAAVRGGLRSQRWYSLVYRAFYLARLRIWERRVPPSDLVELIEGPAALAPGRALDLGCGTGTDSIYLAAHGWDVTGVDMLLDFGCFHTLPPDQRAVYVDNVSAVAAPGGTYLLYGFARPPRLAPMQAGISLDEVVERFSREWEIVNAEQTSAAAIEVARTRVDQSFQLWRFQLRRRG